MPISIQLPPDFGQRLESLVAQTGRSRDELLLQAVENGIYDVEDYYLAHETLERIRRGEEWVYISEEIRAELGLTPQGNLIPKRTLRDAFLILAYREYSEDFFAAQWLSGVSEQSLNGRFERFLTKLFTAPLEVWEEEDLPVLRIVGNRVLDALEVVQEGP